MEKKDLCKLLLKRINYDYFTIREYNALIDCGINYFIEFIICNLSEIIKLRNVGKITSANLERKQLTLRHRVNEKLDTYSTAENYNLLDSLTLKKIINTLETTGRFYALNNVNDENARNIVFKIFKILKKEEPHCRINKYQNIALEINNDIIDYSSLERIILSYLISLDGYEERNYQIATKRIFYGHKLPGIGKEYNITKERVRQIVINCKRNIINPINLGKLSKIWKIIKDIIINYGGKIYIGRLARILELYFNWKNITDLGLFEKLLLINRDYHVDPDSKNVRLKEVSNDPV